ncbi:MAG: LysO family transporter [Rikenellaceae bacterium]
MDILIVVILFVLGIVIGFIFKKKIKEKPINNTITIIIYTLLFMLGVSVGGNERVMDSLGTIGLKSLIIALSVMVGSAAVSSVIYYFVYRNKKEVSDER